MGSAISPLGVAPLCHKYSHSPNSYIKMFTGLMLKDPDSDYIRKRSDKLLKVKKFDDAEAEVIAHIRGKKVLE